MSATPEPRHYDAQRVADLLESREQAVPRLERRDGRVALLVNGEDVFPAVYTRGLFYPHRAHYGKFAEAGYDLVRLPVHLGPLSPIHRSGVGDIWKARDTFDFSKLEHELKVIASINPRALVIVSANIMPYHGWADEYSDSIVTNEKGEKLIESGGEEVQYGGEPDYTYRREQDYAPSFYGGQFPADAARAVHRLGEFLQSSPAGKIVIGVDFTGGTDGQLYPWDRDRARGADHSPAGMAGWRRFLKDRYANDVGRLRAAWREPQAAFDTAPVPTLAERGYRNAAVTQRGIDYNDFISSAMADFILGLGKALKEGSDGRLLAGAYYSDSNSQGVISRHAMSRMLKSPYIDMIRSVMWYQMSGSWQQHNKLTMLEMDMRPWMPNPMQYYTAGLGYSQRYFETLVWRNAAMAVTDLRGGFYPYDMAEGWYDNPEIIGVFGKVRAGLHSALDDTVNVTPVVGVFSDERVPFRLSGTGDYRLMRTSAFGLYRACDLSGVPYARYLIDDALDPSFELPKVCVIRLPMAITSAQANMLRQKARRSGSILVWGYGMGMVASDGATPQSISGFEASSSSDLRDRLIVAVDAGPLTEGMAGRFLGTPPPPISLSDRLRWRGAPYAIQPEEGDVVLGRYAGTDQAGVVMRSRDGVTEIIIGRPGAMSPQFVRNLARSVGSVPFNESNDEMRFGSGVLVFYAERGGSRTITLPDGMTVTASPTGHTYTPTADGFTFEIGYAETAVFEIDRASFNGGGLLGSVPRN